jgi:hypothetical protein
MILISEGRLHDVLFVRQRHMHHHASDTVVYEFPVDEEIGEMSSNLGS